MNVVVSLDTHEIMVVPYIAHYDGTVSPYPATPHEKVLMRSSSLELDPEEHARDGISTQGKLQKKAQNILMKVDLQRRGREI